MPNYARCSKENICSVGCPGCSVVILKPEHQSVDDRNLVSELNNLILSQGAILASAQVTLTERQIRRLWSHVLGFEWSDKFVTHMASGMCVINVVSGWDSAAKTKQEFRTNEAPLIAKLTSDLRLGFSVDIVHGSDPGRGPEERTILNI